MDELKTILLVDDDPNDVELTLQALAEHRLVNEIAVVNDGEQALDFLYRRSRFEGSDGTPPAVVFLDLKMPKVDGLGVLRVMKTVPVVML
ncbi:MAG: response regulator, partial [Gammaproteobacteria bacterium]